MNLLTTFTVLYHRHARGLRVQNYPHPDLRNGALNLFSGVVIIPKSSDLLPAESRLTRLRFAPAERSGAAEFPPHPSAAPSL